MTTLRARGFATLAVATTALVVLQLSLVRRAKEALWLDASLRAKTMGLGAALSRATEWISWIDVLALAAFVAALAVALVAEIRTRAVRRWFEDVASRRGDAALFLLLVGLASLRWLLDSGPLLRHDAAAHTGVVALAAENLRAGEGPWWSFRWHGGFPLLRAYGAGFHVPAAAMVALAGSLEWGVKLTLLAISLAIPFAVARCVRVFGGTREASLVAGLAVILSFEFTHSVAWSGKLAEPALYLLFPLAVAEAWRLARRETTTLRGVAGLGLVASLMVLVHPALGTLGASLACLLAFAGSFVGGVRSAMRATNAFALAGLIAVVALIPLLLAVRDLSPSLLLGRGGSTNTGGVARLGLPGAGVLRDLLVWRSGWTSDVPAYLGLTLVVGGVWGAVVAARRRDVAGVAVLVALVACVPLVGGGYLASRCVAYFVVLLALGLGVGLSGRGAAWALAALALLLVDLGPTTVQAPGQPAAAASRAHLEAMAADAHGGRFVRITTRGDESGVDVNEHALDIPLDAPGGALLLMAPSRWAAFTKSILDEGHSKLARHEPIDAATLRAWALQDVAVLGEDRRPEFGAPSPGVLGVSTSGGVADVRLPGAGPVTFGAAVFPASNWIDKALGTGTLPLWDDAWRARDTPIREAARAAADRMGLDADAPKCRRLLALTPDEAARFEHAGAAVGTATWTPSPPDARRIHVDMTSGGPIRLALAWTPGVRVEADGHPVEVVPDVTGGILLALPAGAHDVEVRGPPSPTLAWGGVLALLAVAAFFRLRR